MMTKIKVYYKSIEKTHSGYCSDGSDYRDEVEFEDEKIIDADIPEDRFNNKGRLKEEYWYDYVTWKKDERIDDLGHCCCCDGGRVYEIYKVKKVKINPETESEIESESDNLD